MGVCGCVVVWDMLFGWWLGDVGWLGGLWGGWLCSVGWCLDVWDGCGCVGVLLRWCVLCACGVVCWCWVMGMACKWLWDVVWILVGVDGVGMCLVGLGVFVWGDGGWMGGCVCWGCGSLGWHVVGGNWFCLELNKYVMDGVDAWRVVRVEVCGEMNCNAVGNELYCSRLWILRRPRNVSLIGWEMCDDDNWFESGNHFSDKWTSPRLTLIEEKQVTIRAIKRWDERIYS
ncbi:hypothetical protein Tco_1053198 [Tanacetum coccineum]